MKQKALTSLLVLCVLAFSGPSWAFACAMPCKMTQKQMMDCAQVCSTSKPATGIGKGDCIRLQLGAQRVYTVAPGAGFHVPEFSVMQAAPLVPKMGTPGLAMAASLRGPPQISPQDFPTANSPPQLI